MRLHLLIFLIIFNSFFAMAQAVPNGWGEETQLTFTTPNSRNPSGFLDASGILHYVWQEDVNGLSQIVYGKRDDNQTLVSALTVSDNNGNDTLPEIVADTNGNAHVVWMSQKVFTGEYVIKYRKVNDAGQVSGPVKILATASTRFPSLDIDSNDNLHVAWQGSNNGYQIYYRKFDSSANPLTDQIQLTSSTTGHSQWPDLKVNKDGEPNLVWTYFNDTSLIYVRLNSDGNILVESSAGLTGSFYNFRDPQIAIDSNSTVHIAYDHFYDPGVNQSHSTSYKRVTKEGAVLLTYNNLNSGQLPNIVVDSFGDAHIVSQAFVSGAGQQVKYAKFPSTGSPVITDLRLTFTGGEAIEPFIFSNNEKIGIIWSDDSVGNWEVFSKDKIPLPVLLVHGIYGNDSIWDQGGVNSVSSKLELAGFTPYKVGKVINQSGLLPSNGNILLLENQLRDAVQIIKGNTGVEKIDVVAHSMGGLVTRSYIDSLDYAGDINNLIMLGTPNEGAPIANHPFGYLLSLIGDDANDPFDTARHQMKPDTFFLNQLNAEYESKGVNHFSVAGTSLPYGSLFSPILKYTICKMQPDYCLPKGSPAIITDSIVPVNGVDFVGSCVLDHNVTHASQLGPTYYDTLSTHQEILRRLKGESSPLSTCNSLAPLSPGVDTEVVDKNGVISSNSNTLEFSNFPVQEEFAVVLSWKSNKDLKLQFTLPNGTIVHSGNYSTIPGTIYEKVQDLNNSIEWYTFTQSPAGEWDVNVLSGNFAGSQDYNITLFAKRMVSISGSVSAHAIAPGQSIIISGALIDSNGVFLGGIVDATIRDDLNVLNEQTIDLFDDGNHNDGGANDGVYANLFTPTVSSFYLVKFTASGEDDQNIPFTISQYDSFEAKMLPDLRLTSADINFGYDSNYAPTPHSIQVRVSNIGTATTQDANIDFYLEDPFNGGTKIGTAAITLDPNQSGWTPKIYWKAPPGDHNIVVFPSSTNSFLDANYANEKGVKVLNICGIQPYGGGGSGGRCFPIN